MSLPTSGRMFTWDLHGVDPADAGDSAQLSNVIEIRSPYRTGRALTIAQERGGSLLLDEQGSLLVRLPLDGTERRRSEMDMRGMMVLLEEVIQAKLSTIVGYAAAAIEHIDPTQRITDVAIAVRISGAEYQAWRTQAQHAASPGSVTIGHAGNRERVPFADQAPAISRCSCAPGTNEGQPRLNSPPTFLSSSCNAVSRASTNCPLLKRASTISERHAAAP
jgi:hypothetical protein